MTKIIVACKLPTGLNPGSVTDPEGVPVIFNGSNHESAKNAGGYGLTEVDEASYKAWAKPLIECRPQYVPLARGLIFTATTRERAEAQGREQSETLTGFEPADPEKFGVKADEDAMGKDGAKSKAALATATPIT